MTKITYEEKIALLDTYIETQALFQKEKVLSKKGEKDAQVLLAIKTDVEKCGSKAVKTGSEAPAKGPEANEAGKLYNECMGIYREFLKGRNSYLDMTGKKAFWYSSAMKGIIRFMQEFAKSNGRPHGHEEIVKGLQFLFNQDNWNRLNDYHRNRIKLPDIYENIEEILPIIRNGHSKQSAAKNDLNDFERSLKNR